MGELARGQALPKVETERRCNHSKAHTLQRPKREVKILKEKNFLLVVRHKGVYCDRCLKLIFNESQARLLGITEEE